jgi:hypothetical protein
MSVLPATERISHEIVAVCALAGLRAIPYEPSGGWQVPCLLIPPPAIEKVTPAIYSFTYELIWVERNASMRAAHVNLNDTTIRLRDALQSDRTLGGTASGVWVRAIAPSTEIRDLQGTNWFGARLDYEVWTSS